MTVYFPEAENMADARYATEVHHVDDKKVFEDDCRIIMLYGRHRKFSIVLIRDEDQLEWAAEPLSMRYTFRIDGNSINRAASIKLKKIADISTAILRHETGLTDTINSVLSYAQAFEDDDEVSFVNARVPDIFEDKILSNFLYANSKTSLCSLHSYRQDDDQ